MSEIDQRTNASPAIVQDHAAESSDVIDDAEVGSSTSVAQLVATMTDFSRKSWSRLEPFADCTVRTSDGLEFRLHKASLAEHSAVLGCVSVCLYLLHAIKQSTDSKVEYIVQHMC